MNIAATTYIVAGGTLNIGSSELEFCVKKKPYISPEPKLPARKWILVICNRATLRLQQEIRQFFHRHNQAT